MVLLPWWEIISLISFRAHHNFWAQLAHSIGQIDPNISRIWDRGYCEITRASKDMNRKYLTPKHAPEVASKGLQILEDPHVRDRMVTDPG
jgi:hypothetical protein